MPVGYVFPKSGTFVIEDGIAVVRGAKHLTAPRALRRFRRQHRDAARRGTRSVPVARRLDLPTDSLPEWCATSVAGWSWRRG